ncbi:MAG: GNAT family N-acetyltransferase [Actinomycetota bacterium]|nr:GNAT family N-acetyltransferase [Actinomycetota bacterium]
MRARPGIDAPPTVSLRPVEGSADTVASAEVFAASRGAAVRTGHIPPGPHPPSDALRHFRDDVVPRREVWLAELDGRVVGVLALDETWLDHLYVLPEHTAQGIGSALLELAKALRPDGFGLWAFVCNTPAQAFYEHHGLVEVQRTDGAGNDERSPDIRYVWRGGHLHGADASRRGVGGR